MANSLAFSTNITSQIDALRYTGNSSVSTATSSSYAISQTVTLYGNNPATAITTGALPNVLAAWFYNDNTVYSGSTIQISGSTNTTPIGTLLASGYSALIPWSGSIGTLYANVTPSKATASLQYILQAA